MYTHLDQHFPTPSLAYIPNGWPLLKEVLISKAMLSSKPWSFFGDCYFHTEEVNVEKSFFEAPLRFRCFI